MRKERIILYPYKNIKFKIKDYISGVVDSNLMPDIIKFIFQIYILFYKNSTLLL